MIYWILSLFITAILADPQLTNDPANPWVPERDVAPPPPKDPQAADSFDSYRFVVKDFLIALGVVFLVVGLLIGGLILFRTCKRGKDQESKSFEKENAALMIRNNSVRNPQMGAAGMHGDLGPMVKNTV